MCEALSCSMDELLGIEKPATPEWEIKKPDWILDISDLSEKDRKEVIAIIEMKRRNQ